MKVPKSRRPRATCLFCWRCFRCSSRRASTRAEAQTKAYVAHTGANVVSVIDTATGTVAGTVPVGAGPDDESPSPATAAARM